MSKPQTEVEIAAARERTRRAQSDAADPAASVWVNANAGTGKTHVLTLRVLRILLAGTPPERILCLTYTKAAAAEMSKRIFDRLSGWVTAADEVLSAELTEISGTAPDARSLTFARTLFTQAIETPGGLKIQTIHAFSERLLQRFPLEAGVPPGFKILDDEKGRELKARAIELTLLEATGAKSSPLGKALATAIRYASDSNFDELLSKAIAERAWLTAAARLNVPDGGDEFAAAERYLRSKLGIGENASRASLERARAELFSTPDLAALKDLLATGGATDIKHSALLSGALAAKSDAERGKAIADYLLTGDHDAARKSVMTKPLAQQRPDLQALAEAAQTRCLQLSQHLKTLALVEASTALYRLAGAVLQRYSDAKAVSGALDFDDLIAHTTNLLNTSSQTQWVLFKLDGGLDHILVDEAQDTSPEQWSIIESLGREFFSGTGAREAVRTVFAVGDEKQSIYSFQGAEPEKFAEVGRRIEQMTRAAGAAWRRVPLNLSFRTTAPVLDAVDAVFASAAATPGLTADTTTTIAHLASRFGQSGLVEIWPTEKPVEAASASPWLPLEDAAERAPANRLADRIADTIHAMLHGDDRLKSENRKITAGDILILVRKRNPFAVPMVAALKRRGIAVAGSDRMALTNQIAVQDLLALGDFLTLPEDDLSLATVLKGPLFNLTDDELLEIAHGRKGTLWKALLDAAQTTLKFKPAAETLKRWRAKADFTPPFEFFSSVLDRERARHKILARLGPEAADAIDEFLDIALAYDDAEPPSLTGFLAALRAAGREVKRDMDLARDEVRVMTVHGAKGLEAPIVFLPDTCTTMTGDGAGTKLLNMIDPDRPSTLPPPVLWQVKGTSRTAAIQAANQAKADDERQERNRLLYVAMTRARDRLYIAGFEGKQGRAADCWYDAVHNALSPDCETINLPDGTQVLRIESAQTAETETQKAQHAEATAAEKLPAFASRRVEAEPQLAVPLAPSRLEPYAPDGDGEPLIRPTTASDPAGDYSLPSPATLGSGDRFLRGNITHALLQYLPEIAEGERKAAATAFVGVRGSALTAKARLSVVKETLAILHGSEFAQLFGPGSRAEVPISAILPRPSGKGPALRLTGQIDRLAVTETEVTIVDFKTNRPPPTELQHVAPAYLFQLAAYALALREIYPGRRLRAALLWTDGPRLMEIPETLLADYANRLWTLDVAELAGGSET